MPQIENVGSSAKYLAKLLHCLLESGTADDQQHRIEIPLDHGEWLQPSARKARRDGRIEPDPVNRSLGDIAFVEQAGGTRKADNRTFRKAALQGRDDALRRLDYPAHKLRFRQ